MSIRLSGTNLKRGLLFFWAVWLTVVFATNLCDGLKELGILSVEWKFASGNYAFMAGATARYGTPAVVNAVLFAGVIAWQAVAAALFWLAGWRLRPKQAPATVYPAFGLSLLLWAVFAVLDEVLIAYPVESTHLRLFVAQLVTLLAVVGLPEE